MKSLQLFLVTVNLLILGFLAACTPAAPTTVPTAVPTATSIPDPTPTLDPQAALFEAVRTDDIDATAALIAAGADIEARDPDTDATPLVIASFRGNIAVVEMLLAAGADVNSADRSGFTPLIGAAQFGHATLIPILVEAGADLEALSITDNQKAALHFAAKNGHAAVVEALLNAGADVNVLVKSTHSTALMNAAYQGHMDVVKILLEHGADTTVLDDGGRTASYWADTRGFKEIAQLIEKTK
jgi:ankyrin repeat protein